MNLVRGIPYLGAATPRSLRRWSMAARESGLLRYIDGRVALAIPKALGVTSSNYAQAEKYYENPQKIWFAFHLLPPPSRQLRTLVARYCCMQYDVAKR